MWEDTSGKQQCLCSCTVFRHVSSGNEPSGETTGSPLPFPKVRLTCLQFLVPISRAMEQKLLKYVPCNTLKSDSSAPLHCTTEASCSVASSSPGRNLVGVWQREFPSVRHTYDEKEKKKLTVAGSLCGKKDITYCFILRTTAHWSHLYTFYQHASIFKPNNFLPPCWIRAWTRVYWKSRWFKHVHSNPDCSFCRRGSSNDFFFFTIGSLPSLYQMILRGSPAVKDRMAKCHLRSLWWHFNVRHVKIATGI